MLVQEHVQIAQDFLEAADREFAAGDGLQGSEKLWGAAAHAMMALAQHRGQWNPSPFGSHRALKIAAVRLADEYGDPTLRTQFSVAEKFHANFYHNFMEDYQLEPDRQEVRDFVNRALALLSQGL